MPARSYFSRCAEATRVPRGSYLADVHRSSNGPGQPGDRTLVWARYRRYGLGALSACRLQNLACSSMNTPFSMVAVATEARRLCPAVKTAGYAIRAAGRIAASGRVWHSILLPA